MTDELARLEREIAERDALCAVQTFCKSCDITSTGIWVKCIDTTSLPNLTKAFRYLELRGLLERHPERPELVRFVEI